MAINVNSSTEFLSRTTGLLDFNQPYTYMLWVYNLATTGSTSVVSQSDNSNNSMDVFGHDSGTTTRLVVRTNGGGATQNLGSNLPRNTWHHWTVVRTSNTLLELYINGVLDITVTRTIAGRDANTALLMGQHVNNSTPMTGYFCATKEFTVALTPNQILAEMFQYLPKIADSRLHGWSPILQGPDRAKAYRGTNWTETGALTDVGGPPITWGGNILFTPTLGVALPSIDTNDSPVLDASTGNAFTTSGYSGDITSATVESGTFQINVLSLAGTGGSYTYSMPDVSAFAVDTAGTPFDSASHLHTLTANQAAETDSAPLIVNPQAGWAVIEVVSAIGGAGSVYENFGTLPVDTDQTYYPTANATSVAADGTLTTNQTTGSINMIFFDTLDGFWKPFTVIISTGTGFKPYFASRSNNLIGAM